MAFLLCLVLLLVHCMYEGRWLPLPSFVGSFAVIAFLFIFPFTRYNFGYWFNHGQLPHSSRVDPFEIINEFLTASEWIKFYLFIILLIILAEFKNLRTYFSNKKTNLFLLLSLGFLFRPASCRLPAIRHRITIFTFTLLLCLYLIRLSLVGFASITFFYRKPVVICGLGILLWWSGTYWKYFQRMVQRAMPATQQKHHRENVVNRNTYQINLDTADIPLSKWKFSGLKSLHNIYLPGQTVAGIDRLMSMDVVKSGKPLHVLNMTELYAAGGGIALSTGARTRPAALVSFGCGHV